MKFLCGIFPSVLLNSSLLKYRPSLQYLRLCNTSTALPTKVVRGRTVQSDDFVDPPKRKRRPKTVYKLHDELKNYFVSPEQRALLDSFPENLKRKKQKGPEHLYLADPETASTVAKHILLDYNGNVPIVEVNPGPGLLTKELLKRKIVTDMRLFEVQRDFLPALETDIVAKHPGRVRLKQGDMLGMWRIAYQDKLDNGKRVETFLHGLPINEWDAEVNMRLFACVGSVNFFKHIINSVVFQNGLMALGRCEYYMAMPPPIYIHLTCDNKAGYLLYRATTMLFQIMFTHEYITKLPRKAFLPFQAKYDLSKHNKLAKVHAVDPEYLYLVKIVPRKNLFQLCFPDQMQGLWYFVKQNCISRKNRIIPNLEKWIPGCGTHLIVNHLAREPAKPISTTKIPMLCTPAMHISTQDFLDHIDIFSQFGDLSPSQILTLYLQFISWPGFKRSPFQASMESSLIKMETSSESLIEDIAFQEQAEDEVEVTLVKKNARNGNLVVD